jgi:hypothetical protein
MSRSPAVVDPPAAVELLRLVVEFLEQEVVPAQADARLRYRVRVAANLLRIARREAEQISDLVVDRDGYAIPREMIEDAGSLRQLADDLRCGRRSLTDPATYALVMQHVAAKLEIAAPPAAVGRDAKV